MNNEDQEDIEAVHEFCRKLAAGEEELIPSEVVNRIIDGENKVRVWREYRGMSLQELATEAEISEHDLLEIEDDFRKGTFTEIKRIISALGLSPSCIRPLMLETTA